MNQGDIDRKPGTLSIARHIKPPYGVLIYGLKLRKIRNTENSRRIYRDIGRRLFFFRDLGNKSLQIANAFFRLILGESFPNDNRERKDKNKWKNNY